MKQPLHVIDALLAVGTFSFLGWLTGYFIGVSTAPVIGAVVPVILGSLLAVAQPRETGQTGRQDLQRNCTSLEDELRRHDAPDKVHKSFEELRKAVDEVTSGTHTAWMRTVWLLGVLFFGIFCLRGSFYGGEVRRTTLAIDYPYPTALPEIKQLDAKVAAELNAEDEERQDEKRREELLGRLWAVYLYCQRLRTSQETYERLTGFVIKDHQEESNQWLNVKTALERVVESGALHDDASIAQTLSGSPNKLSTDGE